jgi:TonB family protein
MTARLILRSAVAALLLFKGPAPVYGQETAYTEDQIREGRQAWDERQYPEAAEHFRLAAFAAVENPLLLTEALARLALAQEAAGAQADADATLGRFLDVEQRSSRYGETALEPPLRAAFERLLRRRVPAERLASVPSLARVARGEPAAETPAAPPNAPSATAVPPPQEPAARAPRPTSAAPAPLPTATALPVPASTPLPPATPTRRPPPPTRIPSSTRTPTETPSPRPTRTPRPPTPTRTESPAPKDTATPTDTPTAANTPTVTRTPTPRPPSATRTPTNTPTNTRTSLPTRTPRPPTPTRTPTPVPPTPLPTRTPLPPTPRPPATPRTVPLEAVDRPPRVLRIVQPVYPPDALRRRVRGLVVLRVLVSETGSPLQLEVVQGAPGGLTESALAAVAQWRFEPAMAGGSPVRTHTLIRIPFEGVQFATPTPSEETVRPREAPREVPIRPTSTSTPVPTSVPTRTPPPAAPPPQPPRAVLRQAPLPVPPEPPSGERGLEGPVFRTRGAVRIALTPDQARVWVDGRFVGIAADWNPLRGGAYFVLERPGPHALHAELPGYAPFEAEVDVALTAESESVIVSGTLSRSARLPYARLPRPSLSTRGSVALAVDRADAQLSVDDVPAGPAAAYTEREPLTLPGPAVHELKITSPGGLVRTIRILVSPIAPAGVPTIRVRLAGTAAAGRDFFSGARRE